MRYKIFFRESDGKGSLHINMCWWE